MAIQLLDLDEVLALHADQIDRYGGRGDIRDIDLLKSAVAMPGAIHDGSYLHGTLFEMAAAYLFHLVQNHPFVDGNKRTGPIAALAFLGINDVTIDADPGELLELVLGVAHGEVSKAEVAVFLKRSASPRR